MPTTDRFKGVSHFTESTLTTQIKENLKSYIDWALLGIGGFVNVQYPSPSIYGGDQSTLKPATDINYPSGTVWQSARANWVYESGLEYQTQPINISGVTVNNVFHTALTLPFFIDYPQGRIVFNSPISLNSVVRCNYSYKAVNVVTSDHPWFKELQKNSFRVDSPLFDIVGSGDWSLLGKQRLQLPAIIIEPVPRRAFQGYQLGGGQMVQQNVLFHVISQFDHDRDFLADVLSMQNEKTLLFFDVNRIAASGDSPLTYLGSKSDNCKTYPQLTSTYLWKKCYFSDTKLESSVDLTDILYMGIVKTTMNFILHDI